MSRLFRYTIGPALVATGIILVGSERQSQQLYCQRVAPRVADCRAEIKTLAGWGSTTEHFADVRSAQVATVNAPLTTEGSTQITKLYPVFLVDGFGSKSEMSYIPQNYEPASTLIVNRVNRFIRSTQTHTAIDLSATGWSWNYTESGDIALGGGGPVPHGALIFGMLLGGVGILLLSGPWWLHRWKMRQFNSIQMPRRG